MPTIYDVARHAGVSIATVSKVLSGRRYVSDKTRQRVLSSVETLQYQPNVLARGLATDRTNLIGLVINYDPGDLFADPILLNALYGIDTEVTEHDFALLLSTARSAGDRLSAYRRLLEGYRVDGVLVETGQGDEGIELLVQRGYPCVAVGYTTHDLPNVHPDDYQGGRLIAQHLIELGHRRFGVISGPNFNPPAMLARMRGFSDVLAGAGLSWDPGRAVHGNFRVDSGYLATAELMQLNPLPTALFAFNDRMAFGAMQWLREHGYQVPGDISVAGFDDVADAAHSSPALTTVHFSSSDIGRRAAAMLFDLISGKTDDKTREVTLPVELICRQSTCPAE